MAIFLSLQFLLVTVVFGSQLNQLKLSSERRLGSVSRFLHYTNPYNNTDFSRLPELNYTIKIKGWPQTPVRRVQMDTGSMGFGIARPLLNISEEYLETFEYGRTCLSSSRTLWLGNWIPADQVDLTFPTSEDGLHNITANIPILGVQAICNCTDNVCCNPFKCWNATEVDYLGVGFGRYSEQQPNATIDKVALANIARIDNIPVKKYDFHPGYIINTTGIEFGLTSDNTAGFSQTKLNSSANYPSPKDWNPVNVSIRVDDTPYNHGTGLFDTGIDDSFIVLNKTSENQLHGRTGEYGILKEGNTVQMTVGDKPNEIAYYSVTVGDKRNPMQATDYILESQPLRRADARPPFINTGRFFYRGFDSLLDPQDGYFGLRWTGKPGSPYGGTFPPPRSEEEEHGGRDEEGGDSPAEYGLQKPIIV